MTPAPDSNRKTASPAPFYKKKSAWLGGFAVVLALLLWAHAWTAWHAQSAKASEALPPPWTVGPEKGVVAVAWLEPTASRARLWILLENRSDNDVLGLRFLTVRTPGYRQVGHCWTEKGPACISPAPHLLKPPLPKGLPSTLKRGQIVIVSALLEESRTGRQGPIAASGFFTWREPQGMRDNAFVVAAAPAGQVPGLPHPGLFLLLLRAAPLLVALLDLSVLLFPCGLLGALALEAAARSPPDAAPGPLDRRILLPEL